MRECLPWAGRRDVINSVVRLVIRTGKDAVIIIHIGLMTSAEGELNNYGRSKSN